MDLKIEKTYNPGPQLTMITDYLQLLFCPINCPIAKDIHFATIDVWRQDYYVIFKIAQNSFYVGGESINHLIASTLILSVVSQ